MSEKLIRQHAEPIQEVLHRAGMSRNSELTMDELAGARRAKAALDFDPTLRRDTIYHMIRPRTDDDD